MRNLKKILVLFTLVITCIGVYSFVYKNNKKEWCYCVGVKIMKSGKEISNGGQKACGCKNKSEALDVKRRQLDKQYEPYKGMGYTYEVYSVSEDFCN